MTDQPTATASALREQIITAMIRVLAPSRPLVTPEELRLVDELTPAILEVVLDHGKFLGDQLRNAEAELMKAREAIARVRAVIAERRTEVAEREADGMLPFGTPGASWCDAITVTCARIDDSLREPTQGVGIVCCDNGPSIREAAAHDRRWPLERNGE